MKTTFFSTRRNIILTLAAIGCASTWTAAALARRRAY